MVKADDDVVEVHVRFVFYMKGLQVGAAKPQHVLLRVRRLVL